MIALNTLTADAADKTWSDSSGHGHRIDYVCTDAALADHIVRAGVLQSIDLATAERSDHNAVVGEVRVPSRPAKTDVRSEPKISNEIPPLKIDVNKTKESWRAKGFAAELQQIYDESHRWMTEGATEWKSPLGIDERISKWMAETRRLAAAWFPRERAQPRKKWLSEEAWTTVRQIAPMRRRRLAEGQSLRSIVMQVVFDGWALLCRAEHRDGAIPDSAVECYYLFDDGDYYYHQYDQRGEERARRISTVRAKLCMATFAEARSTAALGRLQRASRLVVRRDRLRHYEQQADEAAKACARGSTKEMHTIVRILAGTPPRQGGSVKSEAGETLTEAAAVAQRWTRHFAEVFCATVCPSSTSPEASWCKERLRTRLAEKDSLNITWEEVEDLVKKLPRGKGRGPDQVPAELLQASGSAGTRFLFDILCDIAASGHVPFEWKGWRLAPIWKRKGSPLQCSDHRGILLSDHVAKVLTGALQRRTLDAYTGHVGPSQFGCVRGRGTLAANMLTRAVIDAGAAMELSTAVLFLDLSKAFDLAIREVLLGWPASRDCTKAALLEKRGLPREHVQSMVRYIDTTGGSSRSSGCMPPHTSF